MADEQSSNEAGSRSGFSVRKAEERHRYEISIEGTQAGFTEYLDRGNQRIFFHTEIDESFAGGGVGGSLVSDALADTRAAGKRVVPVCPFVAKHLVKYHDFDDITDPVTPAVLAAVEARQA
ncbi:GNAT family N-acetyltransferase [Parasphingorhabdus pacifica]